MAFEDPRDPSSLDKDEAPHGHGQRITGTLMAKIMGHGYKEPEQSHMEPIMDAWEQFRGLGRHSRKVSKAMEVGITMEQVAYARAAELLRMKDLEAQDEKYESARLYEAYRGYYLEDAAIQDGDIGSAANIDGALIDVSGEYIDPRSGEAISGRVYADRQAFEVALHQRMEEDNRILVADGEPPNPIPEPRYTEKLPWMGTADIKVTMMPQVLEENRLKGVPAGWVVQTHHYNKMLREESARHGHDPSKHANLIGVYQYCTATMDGYFHEITHDPELEVEMERRAKAFQHCVQQGIPPNSSEMREVFYEYPVKRTEPEALFLGHKTEQAFANLLDKRDAIGDKIKELEGYRNNIDKDLEDGVNGLNKRMGGTKPKAFFVPRGDKVVLLDYKATTTNRSKIDEVGVNKALDAASQAANAWRRADEVFDDDGLSAEEKLAALENLHRGIEEPMTGTPTGPTDLEQYKTQVKVGGKAPKLSIVDNKKIRAIYQHEVARREAEAESALKPEEVTQGNDASAPAEPPKWVSSVPDDQSAQTSSERPEHREGVSETSSVNTDRSKASDAAPESGSVEGYKSEAYDLKEPDAPVAKTPDTVEPEGDNAATSRDLAERHAQSLGLPDSIPSM